MPQTNANGIVLEYEQSGPADGPPLLLIHGVGAQLTRWHQAFCDKLAAAGFSVIRYDSRDVGMSTHMDDAPIPNLARVAEQIRRGEPPQVPYTLADLATDATGLLDALGIGRAHVLGVSLGGMVAQRLAIDHPERVLSLAIFMSTTGNPDLPGSKPEALLALSATPPDPAKDWEAYVAHSVALNRTLGSPDYPVEEATLRAFAATAGRRAYYPAGAARQLAAARTALDRRKALGGVSIPTLVVHGADDKLIPAIAGEDIAAAIKSSWLLKIRGMGHDLPEPLFDMFISAITANSRRS